MGAFVLQKEVSQQVSSNPTIYGRAFASGRPTPHGQPQGEIAESVGTMIMIIITTYIAVPQLVNNEIFNLKTSGRHLTTIYTTDYIYLQ